MRKIAEQIQKESEQRSRQKEQAIAERKERDKQSSGERLLDLRSKGVSDSIRGVYDPPESQKGINLDEMNYQEGWLSTGTPLPDGVQLIVSPTILGFRSSCRELQDIISQSENQEIEDDTSQEISQESTIPTPKFSRGPRNSPKPEDYKDLINNPISVSIPSYDPDTGNTIATQEPPSLPEEAINFLDTQSDLIIQPSLLQFGDSPFLGIGRTSTIIDRTDYSVSVENLKNYGIETSLIKDHIKNFNGCFYFLDTNSNLTFYKTLTRNKKDYLRLIERFSIFQNAAILNSASLETYFFKFGSDLRTKKSEYQKDFKTSFILGEPFTGSINNQGKDKFKFEKLVDENIELYDNTFSLQMPFENSEMLNMMNLVGASIIDIKENYNFYIKEYEKIAKKQYSASRENVFPNLYVLNALLEENTEEKDFLASLASLGEEITTAATFMLNRSEKIIFGIKDSIGEYFDLFGLNYENLLNSQINLHNSYNNKLNNIIFLSDAINKLNEINKKKYMFPMSIELSIPTDKTTNVTRILMDSELIDNFMIKLYDLYIGNKFVAKDSVIVDTLFTQKINPGNQQTETNQSFSSKRKNINSINISDLLEDIKQNPINLNRSNYTVIGDTKKYMRTNADSMSFVNGLRSIIFNSKLNTFVRNNYRTYQDILNGKKCYNETMAFRISKYEVGSNSPIQNYWIPNSPDLDLFKIVDTQVKYEKEYVYKIFAYQLVLGNKIKQKYNSERTPDDGFRIDVENLPEANLIEIELLSTTKMVADTPPLSPEILFVPYAGVDNKIGIFLNGRTGEERLETINILESDLNVTKMYKSNLDKTVLYKSDDIAKRFEIMKLERKPNSYADFSKGFIKAISTDSDPTTMQNGSSAAFIDTIEPNKKYYYCFRAVDTHEKISNPSQIFEVEIINEKGMVFPIIKNYDFEKPAYSNIKEIRRFIKIKPSSQHTFVDREKSQIQDDTTAQQSLQKIKLGLSDVAVPWGKTFKMVVTSKQTGKKCEFKFKFKYRTE